MGSKNHEVVPTALIAQISQLRHGGSHKIVGDLAKRKLIGRIQNASCKYFIYIFPITIIFKYLYMNTYYFTLI